MIALSKFLEYATYSYILHTFFQSFVLKTNWKATCTKNIIRRVHITYTDVIYIK